MISELTASSISPHSCDGKKTCDIDILIFGTPVPGACKYLDTLFACFPAGLYPNTSKLSELFQFVTVFLFQSTAQRVKDPTQRFGVVSGAVPL